MCRHLAWLGEPRTISSLVLDPPLGLLRQSYQPARQLRGLLNADGWGVGFFDPSQPAPVRWRSSRPLWSDASFASVAPVLRSGAVVAAVRSASVGMPADETAAAPFTDGTWLLSHNGSVDRSVLPATHEAESVCDSAILAAHVFAQGPEKVTQTIRDVAALDPAASLNVLLSDGSQVLAVSWGDPMSYLVSDDGVVVASEPYDEDARWVDVPDRHLLEVTSSGVTVTDLEEQS
jgi:glutamine amidotransferase